MSKDSRLSPLAEEMSAGMSAFCDALEAGEPIEERFTVRSVSLDLSPRPYAGLDVKSLRKRLKASQAIFAGFLGVSVAAVRAWERDTRPVPRSARRFMDEIVADPDLFRRRMAESLQDA